MNEVYSIILGAGLAIGGGWISDEIRSWRERSRELRSIKTGLQDELDEIIETLNSMHEVWTQAKVLSPKYVTTLLSSTTTFDSLRTRLFLIHDDEMRKKIVVFYKKLKNTAKEYDGKLGTLVDTEEAISEQTAVEAEFQKLKIQAESLKSDL